MNDDHRDAASYMQRESPGRVRPGMDLKSLFAQNLLDPVDLRILAGYALGMGHAEMIVQSRRTLSEQETQRLIQLIRRRQNGEPIAYIVGEKEFYGLPFHVSPAVMIPRPETELLVELALENLPSGASLLDLGTGSGAVAIAIARERPDVSVYATDISESAIRIAKKNAERNLGSEKGIVFHQGNWFDALPDAVLFDMIVSNPPYIGREDTHLYQGDLRFEPLVALSDFASGLTCLAKIIAGAPKWLKPAGRLFLEHGHLQAQATRTLLTDCRFESVLSWRDLAGIERVSGGISPA